jgi:hypothetical protein
MRSRISIDLDFNNEPILKIEYNESEDVRDKIVKRFLEKFASISSWCKIEWDHERLYTNGNNMNAGVSIISPVVPKEIQHEINLMTERLIIVNPVSPS